MCRIDCLITLKVLKEIFQEAFGILGKALLADVDYESFCENYMCYD